jgi:hypothetical protein
MRETNAEFRVDLYKPQTYFPIAVSQLYEPLYLMSYLDGHVYNPAVKFD